MGPSWWLLGEDGFVGPNLVVGRSHESGIRSISIVIEVPHSDHALFPPYVQYCVPLSKCIRQQGFYLRATRVPIAVHRKIEGDSLLIQIAYQPGQLSLEESLNIDN